MTALQMLQTPEIAGETELEAGPDLPQDAPYFYSVPCPGVRYYTYDYRPALRRRLSRWKADAGEDNAG